VSKQQYLLKEQQAEYDKILSSYQTKQINLTEAKSRIKDLVFKSKQLDNLSDLVDKKKSNYSSNQDSFVFLVLNILYDQYKGKIAVGKVVSGKVGVNQNVSLIKLDGVKNGKITALLIFDGLKRIEVEQIKEGEIALIAGLADIEIGDTISSQDSLEPLARVEIDEPTIKMTFGVNTSPFSGLEGKFTTSRQIWDRLQKELETNVSLRVEKHPDSNEKFVVSGRGELHLSVLIESMRREGFELEISSPEVIVKMVEGKKCEPYEMVEIQVPEEFQGDIIQELGKRGADIKHINPSNNLKEFFFEALMPTRSFIGLKSHLITVTKGTIIVNSTFDSFKEIEKNIQIRRSSSLVSTHQGKTTSYALDNAQQRGTLFIKPGTEVYQGMIIGEASKDSDLELNPTKEKKLTNMRTKSSDEGVVLAPPKDMTLEKCLEYISSDELVEVTPLNIRIRKRILNPSLRKK